jgi:rubrerythrin
MKNLKKKSANPQFTVVSSVDLSKRALLGGVVVSGAWATLANLLGPAANPALAALAQKKPVSNNDVAFLAEAVKLEQKAINTYQAALQADLIKNPNLAFAATDIANDHSYHRDMLLRVIRVKFPRQPLPLFENLGTFPIPEALLKSKKDAEIVRYALMLETIAAKTYFEAVRNNLATPEAKATVASILAVETQHVGIYRTALMLVLKDKGLAEDKQVVPFSFFNDQPLPAIPS